MTDFQIAKQGRAPEGYVFSCYFLPKSDGFAVRRGFYMLEKHRPQASILEVLSAGSPPAVGLRALMLMAVSTFSFELCKLTSYAARWRAAMN